MCFVEERNRRSMKAQLDGLGMDVIGRFALDGRGYAVLAFEMG